MQLQNPLRALCPTLEAEILLALSSGEMLTPGQLVRHGGVDGSISGVRRCLERLTSGGLVRVRAVGNRNEYSMNQEHLMASAIRQALQARREFLGRLRAEIAQWPAPPVQVTLFGSAARGDMTDASDTDVLFLVEDDASDEFFEHLNDLAIRAHDWTGNDVRPLVYETSEISPAPIFDSILQEGVHVFGNGNWLRQHVALPVAAESKLQSA